MNWEPIPDDELVDVTPFGADQPEYLVGMRGRDIALAEAKARFVAGDVTLDEFEQRAEAVFRPTPPR